MSVKTTIRDKALLQHGGCLDACAAWLCTESRVVCLWFCEQVSPLHHSSLSMPALSSLSQLIPHMLQWLLSLDLGLGIEFRLKNSCDCDILHFIHALHICMSCIEYVHIDHGTQIEHKISCVGGFPIVLTNTHTHTQSRAVCP